MPTQDQVVLDNSMCNRQMEIIFAPFTLKMELEIKSPTFSDTDVEKPNNALELDDVAFAEWPHIKGIPHMRSYQHCQHVKRTRSDLRESNMKLEFPKLNFSINLIS